MQPRRTTPQKHADNDKTLWERHMEELEARKTSGRWEDPRPVKPFNGKRFTNTELRELFKFDTATIRRFRNEERRQNRLTLLRIEQRKRFLERTEAIRGREMQVVDMRVGQGLTYREIGQALIPPVSHERIRQILKNYSLREGIFIPTKISECRRAPIKVAVSCMVCKKPLEILESKRKLNGRYGCCKKHNLRGKTYERFLIDPNYINLDSNGRHNWAYHHDPERRKVMIEATINFYHRVKDTPHHKAQQLKHTKAHAEKVARLKFEAAQKREFKE